MPRSANPAIATLLAITAVAWSLSASAQTAVPARQAGHAVLPAPGLIATATGVSRPFQGQPLQGGSGIQRMADGTFWVLTDHGAGSSANSPDVMLYLNHYAVDLQSGECQRLNTVFLHDPDKKVPFRLVHEGTARRYLTGADFDTERFQFAGGALWIGDEQGPYLIQADLKGKVLAVFETRVDGQVGRWPSHPALTTPAAPSAPTASTT